MRTDEIKCRYYRGEARNPYECETLPGTANADVRAMYWRCESYLANHLDGLLETFSSFVCGCWPDFIRRARASLAERALAGNIDYMNSKHGYGEHNEDWQSYFAGPSLKWQTVPFAIPSKCCDFANYRFKGHYDCSCGRTCGLAIQFGPLVDVIYRGVACGERWNGCPVFELTNLRGDRLYTTTHGYEFRLGNIFVAGTAADAEGVEEPVLIEDLRLQVVLARQFLDEEAPILLVGDRIELPSLAEARLMARRLRIVSCED